MSIEKKTPSRTKTTRSHQRLHRIERILVVRGLRHMIAGSATSLCIGTLFYLIAISVFGAGHSPPLVMSLLVLGEAMFLGGIAGLGVFLIKIADKDDDSHSDPSGDPRI